jgi:hypothetical protein
MRNASSLRDTTSSDSALERSSFVDKFFLSSCNASLELLELPFGVPRGSFCTFSLTVSVILPVEFLLAASVHPRGRLPAGRECADWDAGAARFSPSLCVAGSLLVVDGVLGSELIRETSRQQTSRVAAAELGSTATCLDHLPLSKSGADRLSI